MNYNFATINAFTNTQFQGAQVLVFPEADGLNSLQMQQIAKEFNFSETVFCVKADLTKNQKKFRLFTVEKEIPFAGHPTIAAAFFLAQNNVLVTQDGINEFTIEEQIGEVIIRCHKKYDSIVLTEFIVDVSTHLDSYVPTNKELAQILNIESSDIGCMGFMPTVVTGDDAYLMVPMKNYEKLLKASFSSSTWIKLPSTTTIKANLFLFSPAEKASNNQFNARLLGENIANEDDPPIGSVVPLFASFLQKQNDWQYSEFIIQRGVGRGRLSTINVDMGIHSNSGTSVRVGGKCVVMSQGQLQIGNKHE
ncbi:MAG: PhzF family phenazine biosynthesis protein [Methylococcales bacterium]|nr:PhzF family phenazine biosynthesis protein [Methylococcales bacterium]